MRPSKAGGKVQMKLSLKDGDTDTPSSAVPSATTKAPSGLENYSRYVDSEGKLKFGGKAILHADGVDFSSGNSYKINMAELDIQDELGRGQYGVVNKVFHRPTNALMAMKQIRLEISDSTFQHILMELDILHKSQSAYIVDFYGAFFIESTVYLCMEYMDAGSLDKLYGEGVPEPILARIAHSMVMGLKFLKDELSIIHRDVKPTNVLVNLKGQVKMCDFGVSGQLIQSMAKTNIGCQSYMAPERISMAEKASYTASSDVWSLGITLWEVAMGRYPFPSNKFDSVFAQLNAIVNETPSDLDGKFSDACRSFVRRCLTKNAKERPTYTELQYQSADVDVQGWVAQACERRKK